MTRPRFLTNAPIVEAIIDFRVVLPPDFTVNNLLIIGESIFQTYPTKEELRTTEFGFGVEQGKPVIQSPKDMGIRGYIFKSIDGKNVAQFRMDGFTFSRLQPYTEWQSVFSEAKRLWELYSANAHGLVTRIAVRSINRLDLPVSLQSFAEYLTAPPKVPRSLPQNLSQFLTRIEIQDAGMRANIIQALGTSPKPEHVGVILDIDVFMVSKDGVGVNQDSMVAEFDRLRKFKNRIFFGSITEKMARLCE